jgi:hypothetical protein
MPLPQKRRQGVLTAMSVVALLALMAAPPAMMGKDLKVKVTNKVVPSQSANDLHLEFTQPVRKVTSNPAFAKSTNNVGNPNNASSSWDFSGTSFASGASVNVSFSSSGQSGGRLDSSNSWWTKDGLYVGRLTNDSVTGDKIGYVSYYRDAGGGGAVECGIILSNTDPALSLTFDNFEAWVGNAPANYGDMLLFEVPTGAMAPGVPPNFVLGPGQQFDTGYLPAMPRGTYVLLKAVLTEGTAPPQSMDWAFADDLQAEGAAIPTLSQWGMILLALLVLVAGTRALHRRRMPPKPAVTWAGTINPAAPGFASNVAGPVSGLGAPASHWRRAMSLLLSSIRSSLEVRESLGRWLGLWLCWDDWRVAGDASGSNPSLPLTMDGAKNIQAVFGTSLGVNLVGPGTVVLDPAQGPYPYGSTVQVAAIPTGG